VILIFLTYLFYFLTNFFAPSSLCCICYTKYWTVSSFTRALQLFTNYTNWKLLTKVIKSSKHCLASLGLVEDELSANYIKYCSKTFCSVVRFEYHFPIVYFFKMSMAQYHQFSARAATRDQDLFYSEIDYRFSIFHFRFSINLTISLLQVIE